ncbi:MAG: hypothetical protein COA82_04595 [Alkaliphilus sp.]|nr:hypothetical protein [bacterium AH-315-L21]MBN4062610.1 hypothetical protein [Alkaliphilus sp. AH-315-G20]PHS35343.1 MAG: hypothetical protein COA82_04595 [Alkaliphilus sp.]
MDKAIATIVGIVLVLGLIGYAILGQVAGAKEIGDQAAMEQHKIKLMLNDPSIVTGNTLKWYVQSLGASNIKVDYFGDGKELGEDITAVKGDALFTMVKKYNANGELSGADFTQVNLGD